MMIVSSSVGLTNGTKGAQPNSVSSLETFGEKWVKDIHSNTLLIMQLVKLMQKRGVEERETPEMNIDFSGKVTLTGFTWKNIEKL
jgi:hypothetical protein